MNTVPNDYYNHTLHTVEEFANYAISRNCVNDMRFRFRDHRVMEYIDPEAGAAYDKAWDEFEDAHPNHWKIKRQVRTQQARTPEQEAAITADDEATKAWHKANPQPKKHQVSNYSLTEYSSGRWSRSDLTLHLSDELGALIADIWTKRPIFKGSRTLDFYGSMTIAGILKRLGQKDISGKINNARKLAEMKKEIERRNNRRQHLRSIVKEFQEKLVKELDDETYPFGFGKGSPLFGNLETMIANIIDEPLPTELPASAKRTPRKEGKPRKRFAVLVNIQGTDEAKFIGDFGWTTDATKATLYTRSKANETVDDWIGATVVEFEDLEA